MTIQTGWEVEVQHRVSGSPDVVFEYFTDGQKFRRWQGLEAELDPRPGGIFKLATAPDVWVRGEYIVVDRPRRIVLTWGFETGGTPLPRVLEQVPPGSSVVEFTFAEDGDGTLIQLRHTGLPSEPARWAHKLGWDTFLPRLAAVCRGEDPGDDPIIELAEALYAKDEEIEDG